MKLKALIPHYSIFFGLITFITLIIIVETKQKTELLHFSVR